MKLIFAVLDVSLTMGLTRCYKTEGFFYIYKIIVTNNSNHIMFGNTNSQLDICHL